MRFEVKWNKLKPSTAINDRIIVFEYQPMSAYLDTAINDRIILFEYQPQYVRETNSLVTAINDRIIVFEYQPMSAYLEYAWPPSLAIAQDQHSA